MHWNASLEDNFTENDHILLIFDPKYPKIAPFYRVLGHFDGNGTIPKNDDPSNVCRSLK